MTVKKTSCSQRQKDSVAPRRDSVQLKRTNSSSPTQSLGHAARHLHAVASIKKVVKKLFIAERLDLSEDPVKQVRRRPLAPFSVVSPYQRVRGLLDPVHDRHLLGSDDLQATARRAHTGRRGDPLGDSVSAGSTALRATVLHAPSTGAGEEEEDETTAYQPDRDVPLASVMVPLAGDGAALGAKRPPVNSSTAPGVVEAETDGSAALPDGREIALLPPELAVTFYTVALDRLRKLLLPRALFIMERKRQRAMEDDMGRRATRPTGDMLKKFKLFATWPQDALNQAVDAMTYRCVEANRFVWYTGEPGGTMGIVLLGHGSCRSLRNTQRNVGEKRLTPESTLFLATHGSGHLFNEYSFVTAEPQMRFVKTTSRCDMFCLSRDDFEACCNALGETVRQHMVSLAFLRRQKMIPEAYPFYPQLLRRQCPVFAKNGDGVLALIIQKLQPLATGPQRVLAVVGETPGCIFFLRRGKVGSFLDINGVSTHVRSIYAPETLLESCVIHRQENNELLRTLSDCDFLTITLEDIHSIMSQHPAEREVLMEVSREEKMKILSKQQKRFRPLMYQIPIVRQLLEAEQIATLSHLFEGKVYAAMDIIASRADTCDRIIIATKGEASFGIKGGAWQCGEAIGFTCLIPHRWAHSVVALQQTECIELKRDLFRAFMEDCGVLGDALDVTELLLCPQKLKLLDEQRQLVDKGVALTPEVVQHLRERQALGPLRHTRGGGARDDTKGSHDDTTTTAPAPLAPDSVASYFHRPSKQSVKEQARRTKLVGTLRSVMHDIHGMATPQCYPTSQSIEGVRRSGCVERGFIESQPHFSVTELAVPGGLFAPALSNADKEEALSSAVFALRRDPVRRVAKITPFLTVKQR